MANNILSGWAHQHSLVAARRVQLDKLGPELAKNFNNPAALLAGLNVTVLAVVVDAMPKCQFELRTVSIPRDRWMTSDKGCVELGVTAVWDSATLPRGYTDASAGDEWVSDYVLGDLRRVTASKSQAEVLKMPKQNLSATLMKLRRESSDGNTYVVRSIRVDEIAACSQPFD